MKLVLISPKGPLYRHRGGIFRQNLRYMPLTLPTLTALVPPEIDATVECIERDAPGHGVLGREGSTRDLGGCQFTDCP